MSGTVAATRTLRLGTRGSRLAMAQAGIVEAALRAAGSTAVEIVTIETAGDRRRPDSAWGEGAFVAAIEEALRDGRVDVAIHSAKDVPTDEAADLAIAAYLPREDPRDALVVRAGDATRRLADLPAGARLGTDSPRRSGFVLARRGDLRVHPLSGNVDTRLRRLDGGETDALVLAVAGLVRLGLADRIAEIIDPAVIPPAPGQGAIAVQVRSGDEPARSAVAALDDGPTRRAVEAERAFLVASGGGCRAPIGALATVAGERIEMIGGWAAADGSATAFAADDGPADGGAALGHALAARLGTRRLVSGSPPAGEGPARVLVARPAGQATGLLAALGRAGIDAVAVPAIEISPVAADELATAVVAAGPVDWTVVTSANGARAALGLIAGGGATAAGSRWAAVGAATRSVLDAGGVAVDHWPALAGADSLAAGLPIAAGDRILLLRGDLAGDELPAALRARGAVVHEVVAYRTTEAPAGSERLLREALEAGPFDAIVFSSGSTVRGLVALAPAASRPALLALPAVCIGPSTAAAARRAGFTSIVESASRDDEGLAAATRAVLARPRPETP